MNRFERFMDGPGKIRSVLGILYRSARSWIDTRAVRLGAAVAYYALFAMVPVLMLAIALASIFIDDSRVTSEVIAALSDLVGDQLAAVILEAVGNFRGSTSNLLVSLVSVVALVFSATLLFVAWKDVVDIMWNAPRVRGARGTLQRRLFALLAVLGAGALLTLNLMVETVFNILGVLFTSTLLDTVIAATDTIVPATLGAVFIGVLYKYTPDIEIRWRSVWLGAVVSMTLLSLGAWAYGLYVSYVGFGSATGLAGAAFLGLALVYYAAMILLYGMEIVRESESLQRVEGAGG